MRVSSPDCGHSPSYFSAALSVHGHGIDSDPTFPEVLELIVARLILSRSTLGATVCKFLFAAGRPLATLMGESKGQFLEFASQGLAELFKEPLTRTEAEKLSIKTTTCYDS